MYVCMYTYIYIYIYTHTYIITLVFFWVQEFTDVIFHFRNCV